MGSMDSYTTYFGRTMAHNISLAAANVGANRVLFDHGYNTSFSGPFGGGSYAVTFWDYRISQHLREVHAGGVKIQFGRRDDSRHRPRRLRSSPVLHLRMVHRRGEERLHQAQRNDGSLSTGPATGRSPGTRSSATRTQITSSTSPDVPTSTGRSPGGWQRRSATLGGVKDPVYNEGYEWGVTINRDTANIGILKSLANAGNPFSAAFNGNDVGLEFFSSGDVRVKVPHNTGATLDTTVPLSVLSSTKVIGAINGDLHIKGTYKGKATVCAFTGTGATAQKGNVWIDGDLVAADNPRTNPGSTDMMGVVAERMGYITKDLTRNSSSVLNIQAAIYCHNGEFTAEDFWTIPKSGRVSLYGSITQKTAGSLGVFSFSSGLLNGYFYSIRHDARFLSVGPPAFPFSSKLKLIAWWEN